MKTNEIATLGEKSPSKQDHRQSADSLAGRGDCRSHPGRLGEFIAWFDAMQTERHGCSNVDPSNRKRPRLPCNSGEGVPGTPPAPDRARHSKCEEAQ